MRSLRPFDSALKSLHRSRVLTASTASAFDYVRAATAESLSERLVDVTRDFPVLGDLGFGDGSLHRAIKNASAAAGSENQLLWGHERYVGVETAASLVLGAPAGVTAVACDPEYSDLCPGALEAHSMDAVVSNMSLHWCNDMVGVLKRVNASLRPDGMFLAAFLGGDTLHELRGSMALAEQERDGGISNHISPMLPVSEACGLLTSAGFTLVTVDTIKIEVAYDSAFSLMRHLWWMGESNAVKARRSFVPKNTMLATAAAYQSMFGDETNAVPATFEVIFLIGWTPHDSQAKPLPPGTKPQRLIPGKVYSS